MKLRKTSGVLLASWLLFLLALPVQAQDAEFERTLTVNEPVVLSVETRAGTIVIRGGKEETVVIRGKIRRRRDVIFRRGSLEDVEAVRQDPPVVQEGNTIRVGKLADRLGSRLSIDYEIEVPEAARVNAEAGSGSIRVENIAGDTTVATGNGSIRALAVSGRFEARTGNGSIHAKLNGTGNAVLETGFGSIDATGIQGSLRAKTGSGSMRLAGRPGGEWSVRADSGGITVAFPPTANFDLRAWTDSGDIVTGFPVTLQGRLSVQRDRLEGKVGGGGPLVEVHTSNGSIQIENSNEEDNNKE